MTDTQHTTWETIAPEEVPDAPPARELMRAALDTPETRSFLNEAGAADQPVILLVNDSHRRTQTRIALIALSAVSNELPNPPRFRAIVATGTHRFPLMQRTAFASETFSGCGLDLREVVWHDANKPETTEPVAGVRLHRLVADGRFLLPIGSVEPHYLAGVTGAHKTATIGCMSFDDIQRNHALALSNRAEPLRLVGNPVFDDIAGILRGFRSGGKRLLAINQVVSSRGIVRAAAGDPIDSLDELLPTARRLFANGIARPFDVLHLKVPPPLGRNLYQADKALKNNHRAVRDGGGIVLEADCPEGVGSDGFCHLLRRASDHATATRLVQRDGYRLGDHKAIKLRHLTDRAHRGVRIALVSSNVSESDASLLGMKVVADLPAALQWLSEERIRPPARGLIIEDAGHACVIAGASHA